MAERRPSNMRMTIGGVDVGETEDASFTLETLESIVAEMEPLHDAWERFVDGLLRDYNERVDDAILAYVLARIPVTHIARTDYPFSERLMCGGAELRRFTEPYLRWETRT